MAKKFTYRKDRPTTGLMGCGRPYPDTIIKIDANPVGIIVAPIYSTKDNLWRVRFTVADTCRIGWRWMELKKRFTDEPLARQFIDGHFEELIAFKPFPIPQ